MAGIKFYLGLIPGTAQFEKKNDELKQAFDMFTAYGNSEEWSQYIATEQTVLSPAFAQRRKAIETAKFSDTPEYTLEKEYQNLAASKDIKTYLKLAGSEPLKKYQNASESSELARLTELEQRIRTEAFLAVKRYMAMSGSKKWEASDESRTLAEYTRKKASPDIRNYRSVASNKLLPGYQKALAEGLPGHVKNLHDYLQSAEYKATAKALKAKRDGQKWQGSEEEKLTSEYKQLLKRPDYKAYLKLAHNPALADYNKLEGSAELEAFIELEKFCLSETFKARRKEIENQRYEQTPEYTSRKSLSA